MSGIIVAFPKMEDAKSIRNILVRHGFNVIAVCTTGSQAINYADTLNDGIVVCGYKLSDMLYSDLRQDLPSRIDLLLVASQHLWSECTDNDIVCLSMPIKVYDLVNTAEMMQTAIARKRKKLKLKPRQRSPEEQKIIASAKALLMERNNMTEEEAHRYIQKTSMDSGTSMVETAQMVFSFLEN